MRIVSLLASATEMIAALGCLDQLVGRSHECDYPHEVLQLPLVSNVQIDVNATSEQIDAQIKQIAHTKDAVQGNALRALSIYVIDTDLLQTLQPDIIFTQTQCEVCAVSERDVIQALQQVVGIQPRIVSLAPYRLSDVWEDLIRVGEALDRKEQAQQLVNDYQQRLNSLAQMTAMLRTKPRVAVLEWLDPLMVAGNWTPELINVAGGEAIFGRVGEHSPWLTWEELVTANPNVLVLSPCGFSLERTMQDIPLLQRHPAWQELQAVQQGRVYAIDGIYYLNRSGPRLVESAELLARALWGERLTINVDESAWREIA
ncbi:cobalamin-binding protein [Reticulibacter mediterranei]|uniref:Cobalamin-binding protein n=1 Tax=Reticulibacter mediterranei TaxID=2778369 RepID=A0A8J3II76_9CHLR|nr:cobalamin-binding protein [Reticulibacter mediterranei]GHO95969.1 cobalamin-binding protein [Reticulibacter mediterranei]